MGPRDIKAPLLLGLRRLLSWIFKYCPKLLGHLSGYLGCLCSWLKACSTKPTPPCISPNPGSSGAIHKTTTPYSIVRNGNTLRLDGIAQSLYPFSTGGIRNTSRSSIRSSYSAHSRSYSPRSRRASVQSRDSRPLHRRHRSSESRMPSPHSDNASLRDPDSNPMVSQQPHISRRQRSTSMPNVQTANRGDNIAINVQPEMPLISGQHSFQISPISFASNAETMSISEKSDPTTLESHQNHVSTRAQYLSHSNDHANRSPNRLSESSTEERHIQPVFPDETARYTHRTKMHVLHFAHLTFLY